MNHQYYLIRRFFVRPGGQKETDDICMSFLRTPYEGCPSILESKEKE